MNERTIGMARELGAGYGFTESTNPIELIRKFNALAGNTDDVFNPRQAALYMGLQCEELAEKLNSLARRASHKLNKAAVALDQIADEFKRGTYDDVFETANPHDLMDDDVDLFVVTVGSLLSQGVDVHGAIAEVNRANMAKVFPDGTMHRDPDGKIIKPDGWTPPDLAPFVCHVEASA